MPTKMTINCLSRAEKRKESGALGTKIAKKPNQKLDQIKSKSLKFCLLNIGVLGFWGFGVLGHRSTVFRKLL